MKNRFPHTFKSTTLNSTNKKIDEFEENCKNNLPEKNCMLPEPTSDTRNSIEMISYENGFVQKNGIHTPEEGDVLCGRGKGVNNHKGNIRFRDIVRKHTIKYHENSTTKTEKSYITSLIVAKIRSLQGRFLELDQKTNSWTDIGDRRAKRKAAQALREITKSKDNPLLYISNSKYQRQNNETEEANDSEDKTENIFVDEQSDCVVKSKQDQQDVDVKMLNGAHLKTVVDLRPSLEIKDNSNSDMSESTIDSLLVELFAIKEQQKNPVHNILEKKYQVLSETCINMKRYGGYESRKNAKNKNDFHKSQHKLREKRRRKYVANTRIGTDDTPLFKYRKRTKLVSKIGKPEIDFLFLSFKTSKPLNYFNPSA